MYNDFQVKVKTKIDNKNEITFIGLGAIDNFELNLDANETEEQQYFLGNLLIFEQWNYTNGLVYKRYNESGYWTFVASRNMLNNVNYKYEDNDVTKDRVFDYKSQEIENKFRIENTTRKNGYKINFGVNYELAKYNNRTSQLLPDNNGGLFELNFNSDFVMNKYGAFAQVSKTLMKDRLILSAGVRMDGNDYSTEMSNPFKQLSPRFSAAYAINEKVALNFNTGLYYQLPAYTILGYQEDNQFVNKDNGVTYIRNAHIVGGVEYNPTSSSKFTIEGYYKTYDNYPFLTVQEVALANLGSDFGVIGNAPVTSTASGRTYGLEFFLQQKLYKGFYGIASYTLGFTEFEDKNGDYQPSSWDSRHILSLTGGKRFKGNWEMGLKWRFQSGLPFTPDSDISSLVQVWNQTGRAIPDYDRLNQLRNPIVHELDFRIDKKWSFAKWSLNLYLDIENAYGYSTKTQTTVLDKSEAGIPVIINPTDPINLQRYATKTLELNNGQLLPTIGIIIEI